MPGRMFVAAVGMFLCATSPIVVTAIPGLQDAAERAAESSYPLAVSINLAILLVPLLPLAVLLPVVARADKASVRDYLGRVPVGRAVRGGLATTVAAATGAAAVIAVLRLTGVEGATEPGASGHPVAAVILLTLAQAFALQAIQEECWFRGFAFRHLAHRPWAVLAWTTAVFTVLHLVSSGGQSNAFERVVYLCLPLGMGLWAGVERWCSGSVWAAVGVHGGMHTGFLVATLTDSAMTMPTWIGVGAVYVAIAVARLMWVRPWMRPADGAAA